MELRKTIEEQADTEVAGVDFDSVTIPDTGGASVKGQFTDTSGDSYDYAIVDTEDGSTVFLGGKK